MMSSLYVLAEHFKYSPKGLTCPDPGGAYLAVRRSVSSLKVICIQMVTVLVLRTVFPSVHGFPQVLCFQGSRVFRWDRSGQSPTLSTGTNREGHCVY
jgi:hypothetical protein